MAALRLTLRLSQSWLSCARSCGVTLTVMGLALPGESLRGGTCSWGCHMVVAKKEGPPPRVAGSPETRS